MRLGLEDGLAEAWPADVRSGWTKFAHPYTPYEFTKAPAHLAGASEVAGLGYAARREFAELLMHGLRTWDEEALTVTVHRPTYPFKDAHVWPTPLASYLRSMDWLPVEGPRGPVLRRAPTGLVQRRRRTAGLRARPAAVDEASAQ
ncbi:hypothetical protein GTV15_21735 [Streptomyces sp. SID7803]|nr:hypothetical protein [Streptomyces sp. SID7803]